MERSAMRGLAVRHESRISAALIRGYDCRSGREHNGR
jgi:hypothetical protein